MRYSTIVERNEGTLLEIIDALGQFDEHHFIASIQLRNCTLYEVEQALDMVHVYQSRMNIEARSLARFSETFIQQFATDNNKCFTDAERYFNRIRSTLCALKAVFHKTCPRIQRQLPEGVADPTVFERSALSGSACSADLFGMASYDDVVQLLFKALETLLTTATSVLTLCHRMIETERMVRQDSEQLRQIYRQSCDSLMSSVREFANFMGASQQVPQTEMDERRKKARSMDEFLRSEYHNVPKKMFKMHVFVCALREGQQGGLSDEEMFLWGDQYEKVRQVRWVIEHFDDLQVQGRQGKLDSTDLVSFLKWCGVKSQKERRLYEYFCNQYEGSYRPLGWSAVSKERKSLRESRVSDAELIRGFQQRIDDLQTVQAV